MKEAAFSIVSRDFGKKILYFIKSCVGLQRGGRAVEAVHPFIVAVLNIIMQNKDHEGSDGSGCPFLDPDSRLYLH